MENRKIVVGNMKMNLDANDINKYLKSIKNNDYNKQVVFCPSSIYLPYFIDNKYGVGIQNISQYDNGAYTGEISANQAVSMKIDYVIIGHSERREYFLETDEIVRKKIDLALNHKLKIILCIGETEAERDNLNTYKVLKKQITSALKGIDNSNYKNIIIAYEPIWSIGTGKVPNNTEIEDTISFIKKIIDDLWKFDIRVLYGGSVNEKNINNLNNIPNIGGYLVGGASTDPNKFKKIIEVVVNQ